MKCFTPEISWHNRDPILSVDIQQKVILPSVSSPSSSSSSPLLSYRIATCGNDSHVIIWKASICERSSLKGKSKDSSSVSIECLADLTRHQRAVNVVRFAPNDSDFLAAGDDDCVIIIWQLQNQNNEQMIVDSEDVKDNPNEQSDCQMTTDVSNKNVSQECEPNAFSESDVIAHEIWKPYKVLRGHIQDVCDVCWSPDGQMLVSGSVDNSAIVWDVQKGQKLHIFTEHKGFVQGVSWDPLNKYITTLSADRTLRIINWNSKRTQYRVYKTQIDGEKTSRIFYDDTLRSFCRRLTFTPGGEFLIAPSGILEQSDDGNDKEKDKSQSDDEKSTKVKDKKDDDDGLKYINTSYIFARKTINKPSMYLPSAKYTIAVRCCPQLFQLHEDFENPFLFPYRIVFAVATQDSVLFYDTQQSLPFASVSQIHYLRLTDIAWSPDGRMLIISSTDGFATFVTFDANEIGIPYNGPKYQEIEESIETDNSPVTKSKSAQKVELINGEVTPEVEKTSKRLSDVKLSTPSIKAFFRPKSEVTPTHVTHDPKPQNELNSTPNNIQTLVNGSEQTSCGVKRKEVIDLTEDSDESWKLMMSSNKRSNLSSSPNRSPLKLVNNKDIAAVSLLMAPANCKVKDNSVRKLTAQFNEVAVDRDNEQTEASVPIASHLSSDAEMRDDQRLTQCVTHDNKLASTDPSNDFDNPHVKVVLSSNQCANTVQNNQINGPKQPRRIQLITLQKKQ